MKILKNYPEHHVLIKHGALDGTNLIGNNRECA